ncbi:hypothetical protein [uncultured Dokdonia sp.]|uniref:hypothetical protein n=1 Tax=uncultured Dokdonia sp. TaxID=575653 RepID=UPI002607C73E|nr:hypothetical protein [uncultured Dokdonia sp.]
MQFRILFLFLFLSGTMLQAQVQTPTINGILDIDASNFFIQTKRVQNMDINFSFRFNRLPNIDGINSFSRFNRVTGLNDTYVRYKEKYEYTSSSILLENQFRISKIDSFNPNGSTSFGNAVVNGVLNLIFN